MRRIVLLAILAALLLATRDAHALKGSAGVAASGGVVSATISATDRLACDGATDDRATFKGLVEVGGDWAGKTVDFSQCTMLWSACTSGTGDCTVATVAPGTRLLGKPGSAPTVTLARASCVGGNTPGASCSVNGASDCNGGSCVLDCPSGGTCGVTNKVFAHTAAATYTLLAGPSNAACSSSGTPWPCCTGSALGFCDMVDQNIEVTDWTIAANQVEDYGRCTNGSTEDGKACRGYCSANSAIPNFSCSEDSDCVTGTCVNASLCPGPNIECDGASQAPAGTGAINIIDMSGAAGVRVAGLTVLGHLKGKGVLVGQRSTLRRNNLIGIDGFSWNAPNVSLGGFYPAAVSYGVTTGIQAGTSSVVEDNRVRGSVVGIDVTATGSVQVGKSTYVTAGATRIVGNSATGTGDNFVAMRSSAPDSLIQKNVVQVTAGDFVFGIIAAGDRSTVEGNNVDLNTASDTDGVGIEIRGLRSASSANLVDVAHTTRATGIRIGSNSCGSWPCTEGYFSSSYGDSVTVGAGGVAYELFGDHASADSSYAGPGTGGQCFAVGQNSNTQQRVTNVDCFSGAVGVGPSDRKVCVGGADNGKICKDGSTAAAACSGGTCTYNGFGSNYSLSVSRIAFQSSVGAYFVTGTIDTGNYIAWQGAVATMLGDDRVNVGQGSGHFAITGGIKHANASGVSLIKYAPVAAALCTATDTPWDCCTGNGTGTCGTVSASHGTITGVDLLGSPTNVIGIDFSTGWGANSPQITNIAITGVNCQSSASGTVCMSFPSSNQSKITSLTITGTRSLSATTYANWSWGMGRIAEFVQRMFSTGMTLPTSGTTANFWPVVGRATVGTTESAHTMVSTVGSALSMRCSVTAAPSTPTRILTLRKAGADTSLTCTIGSGATECNAAAVVDFTSGQTINWQANKATGTATANDVGCMLEFGLAPY